MYFLIIIIKPSLLYTIVLAWIDMPVLFKEFMTEGEYFTLLKKLHKDETIYKCGEHLKDSKDYIYSFSSNIVNNKGYYEYYYTSFKKNDYDNIDKFLDIIFSSYRDYVKSRSFKSLALEHHIESYELDSLDYKVQ